MSSDQLIVFQQPEGKEARPDLRSYYVCLEEGLQDTIKAPCGHTYCPGCLREFVQASLGDASIFPPKCCEGRIPIASLAATIDEETLATFTRRFEE